MNYGTLMTDNGGRTWTLVPGPLTGQGSLRGPGRTQFGSDVESVAGSFVVSADDGLYLYRPDPPPTASPSPGTMLDVRPPSLSHTWSAGVRHSTLERPHHKAGSDVLFWARYTDQRNSGPRSLRLVIRDAVTEVARLPMYAATSGALDWRHGVAFNSGFTFRSSGEYAYYYEGQDGRGNALTGEATEPHGIRVDR